MSLTPVPPQRGPSFREMMEYNGRVRSENESLVIQNDRLVEEIRQLKRDKEAQRVLIEVLKKRIRSLSSQASSSSASRSSQPSLTQARTKRFRHDGDH